MRRFEKAILEVEDILGRYDGFNALVKASIDSIEAFSKRHIVAAWHFLLPCPGKPAYEIWLGIDAQFPHSWPVISLSKDLVLKIPHVEHSGKICISSEHDRFRTDNPGNLILEELRSIACLLGRDEEAYESDFQNEFQSYLNIYSFSMIKPGYKFLNAISLLSVDSGLQRIVKLLVPNKPKLPALLAEGLDQGKEWFRSCRKEIRDYSPRDVPLFFYPKALIPSEYPKTGEELFDLVAPHLTPKLSGFVTSKEFLTGKHREIAVVFETFTGRLLTLWQMQRDNSRHDKHAPRLTKYLGPLAGVFIPDRIDGEWLAFRGGMGRGKSLHDKTVAIIGCGSVGGYVAEQLVKSGVGEIHLVDPELMEWENAGRHILGGSCQGQPKPSALKDFFNQQFPSCNITAHDSTTSNEFYEKQNEIVDGCDLLLVLTGNATLMRQINYANQKSASPRPFVYGWTEEYGLAGHAVFASGSKGCLQCIMDDFFNAHDQVISWDERYASTKLPGCGSSFASFGTAEIMPITGLISSLCLDVLMGRAKGSEHRIWIGRSSLLDEAKGARWSSSFEGRHGNIGEGGKILAFKITPQERCMACDVA